MCEVYLRPVKKEDIKYIHQWWNNPDNFGATNIENGISIETVLSRFEKRHFSEPYEEWFSICVKNVDRPV